MPRIRALILAGALAGGILWGQKKTAPKQETPKQQEPAEEDATLTAKPYAFNPLQAEKEIKVGNFYAKKGSWKAAAYRFREATKWNPGLAEAYYRLGEAEEKLNDPKAAQQAWAKFLELAPNDKRGEEIRKKTAATQARR